MNEEKKTKLGENIENATRGGSDADLEVEIQAGEWQRLSEFDAYRKRSRQGKIIATYQAVANRLSQLVTLYLTLVRSNPQKAIKLLKELKKLRFLQSYLLDCLVWEEQGEFSKHELPQELEGLL